MKIQKVYIQTKIWLKNQKMMEMRLTKFMTIIKKNRSSSNNTLTGGTKEPIRSSDQIYDGNINIWFY